MPNISNSARPIIRPLLGWPLILLANSEFPTSDYAEGGTPSAINGLQHTSERKASSSGVPRFPCQVLESQRTWL